MSEGDPSPEEVIAAALIETATAPATISNETGSVSTRSVSELIALDRYLASKAATQRPSRGLRWSRFVPPGAV
jgi:hypothetical protein